MVDDSKVVLRVFFFRKVFFCEGCFFKGAVLSVCVFDFF